MKKALFYLRFLHGIILLSIVLSSIIFFIGNKTIPESHLLNLLIFINYGSIIYILQTIVIIFIIIGIHRRDGESKLFLPIAVTVLGTLLTSIIYIISSSIEVFLTNI
ncbi:MAG: hypothetical protein K9K80_02760 [Spirochaetia bacterium]|nr:hypothetical protein [Spirochaetia bacterium]